MARTMFGSPRSRFTSWSTEHIRDRRKLNSLSRCIVVRFSLLVGEMTRATERASSFSVAALALLFLAACYSDNASLFLLR